MKTKIFQGILAVMLVMAFGVPGVAYAGKGCSFQGTWFGVVSPEDTELTGWMVTVAGQSSKRGTNNLEYPTFDPTLGGAFSTAVSVSTLRGAWERTSGNTFIYTMTGIAVDAGGMPVWIGKLSGHITLSGDCNSETITATLEVFLPSVSPFAGDPYFVMPLPTHYGYRAYVDLP